MPEKYVVRVFLNEGTSGSDWFDNEYDDQDQAIKYAQSAACTAHARSNSDGSVTFYPAHRVDRVEVLPFDPAEQD